MTNTESNKNKDNEESHSVTCAFCEQYKGQMAPPHNASDQCESGGRNHCSCDKCF